MLPLKRHSIIDHYLFLHPLLTLNVVQKRGEREKGKRLDDLRVTTEETRVSMEDERDDIKKSDMIYACRLYVYVRM